ncbi:hypothetical protein HFP89_08640 [Wenzhouxiangella sp. XN79A]|nr:hypothetical protein [Wenzhouxiangella sp. XN79A]
MIAVAILAIVMGIAIPSYNQWVIESGRADGKAQLFQVAQQLERCFTRYSSYDDAACGIQDGASVASDKGKYIVAVDTTATTFTLTAAPQGGQANDDECQSLTLTHTGQRGLDGGATGTIDDCW